MQATIAEREMMSSAMKDVKKGRQQWAESNLKTTDTDMMELLLPLLFFPSTHTMQKKLQFTTLFWDK